MKTVGIIVDNYKLEKFKKTLLDDGFISSVFPFMKNTTLIKIYTDDNKIVDIKKICQKLNIDFNYSN